MTRFAVLCAGLSLAVFAAWGCTEEDASSLRARRGGPGSEDEKPSSPLYAADPPTDTSGKLLRISPSQYENMVADVLGVQVDLSQVLDADTVQPNGFRAGYDIAPSLVPRYADAADRIAAKLVDEKGPAAADCLKKPPVAAPCVQPIVDGLVTRLWRRPLDPAEVTSLVDIANGGAANGQSAYAFWFSVLTHPSFLYVVELPHDDGKVDDFELAARLSLTFLRSAPDAELFDAAKGKSLGQGSAVEAQLARLSTNPRFADTVEQFFGDWANKPLSAATLDPEEQAGWSQATADSYNRSLNRLYRDTLEGNVLDRLLASSEYVADDTLLKSLGLPTRGGAESPFQFGPDRNGGILTHPAFLAASATPAGGDIVRRGIFVLRQLLCEPGVAIPPGLSAQVPEQPPALTNRSRFDFLLTQPSCAGCHKLFQPFGNALENFDAVGKWRTDDHGQPIDGSGTVTLAMTSSSISFTNATTLAKGLRDSPQVSACLTRYWFRYALGGPYAEKSGKSLESAHQAFTKGGTTLKALVTGVATSDAFRRYTKPEN
jgi:hypothetical protein